MRRPKFAIPMLALVVIVAFVAAQFQFSTTTNTFRDKHLKHK